VLQAACGHSGPLSPTSVLPASRESASFSYRFSTGDSVQADRQEAHHAWAIAQLDVTIPQRIIYNKYVSRAQMEQATGRGNTNGFAEPERFTVHTLWPWDNHEPVHVYTALIGRPSDFFNEGIAVAFQTDPAAGDFESRFNGQQVHDAALEYRRQGRLLPLDRIIEADGFRAVADSTLTYREAGSFVRFLIDRSGFEPLKAFFRTSARDDSRAFIEQRFEAAFGRSLATTEREWHAFLEGR
jgi:hypothetical protein